MGEMITGYAARAIDPTIVPIKTAYLQPTSLLGGGR